ncbi:hypothetical protein [Pyrofollis japonicus]|uniref:hypothetical protein n=1 Tax=Pyrofollis japonicus TaxID=3060460 RepID=UPI00295AB402|nr:hypothetical protein [Pyrofollis japonicus]
MQRYGKLLLSIGYLSAPFAGPGSAVITAAGWLSYGSESGKNHLSMIGLIGLLGVAGILSGTYVASLSGLQGAGGVLLLLYFALGVAAIWMLGSEHNNSALKAAAMLLAVSWLLAVAGASDISSATSAASGTVIDWGGVSWANAAAHNVIQKIGGSAAIAKALALLGAVLASFGFLSLNEARTGISHEETIFSIGTY